MTLVRLCAVVYFAFFAIAVTWPGFTLVNRVEPLILGLPFNLFALAVLILGGMGVLYALYRTQDDPDHDGSL
ncbi:MAG: hypothetical protein ACFB6R_00870 [Alphaproteobacteria bacterium]